MLRQTTWLYVDKIAPFTPHVHPIKQYANFCESQYLIREVFIISENTRFSVESSRYQRDQILGQMYV